MKAIILILIVLLTLSNLDNIYVGIYSDNAEPEYRIIQPDKLDYELSLDLEDGQEAYYFYNCGFGKYDT